jgi:hypothetical protein
MEGHRPLVRVLVWLGHLLILAGATAAATIAWQVLAAKDGLPLQVALPRLFPFAEMSLSVDGLSAFFLLVVALIAAAVAIYGPSYLSTHAKAPLVQTVALGVFVACMALVCCAGDGLTFLLAWEGMTLASYVLVVCDTRSEENARAGLLYLVMAHAGTAALLVVFLTLADRAQGFDFVALRAAAHSLDGGTRTVLFMLALGGFGAKAGVVPLHVWLPKAHPAAPSHASALMSGVMLKVAIYGIFRFGFDLLAPESGPLPASWGWIVLLLGAVSAVMGVLLALQQHDLKRLLAFHSVENVGIILIGAGVAMLLGGGRAAQPLATLALGGLAASHPQPRGLQGPAVSGSGERDQGNRRAQHGRAGRARSAHAVDGLAVSARGRGHLGVATAQWLRERVDDLPGTAARRGETGWCLGLARGCRGLDVGAHGRPGRGLLRQGLWRDLSRPPAHPARRARHGVSGADDCRHAAACWPVRGAWVGARLCHAFARSPHG